MHRKYKIGSDGEPKYDGDSYSVAPERRFSGATYEWKKRLDGNGAKALRRRQKKQSNKFTLKVKHIVYAIILFTCIGIAGKLNTSIIINPIVKSSINITLNSAVADMGNDFIKPSTDNMFLHVNLNLENLSRDSESINLDDFTLLYENGEIIKALYLGYQSENKVIELSENTKDSGTITFEVPMTYKGELELLCENAKSYAKSITKFNLE